MFNFSEILRETEIHVHEQPHRNIWVLHMKDKASSFMILKTFQSMQLISRNSGHIFQQCIF
jgi:hypothetical protein